MSHSTTAQAGLLDDATAALLRRRARALSPGYVSLDDAPVVLTIDELAAIYRNSVGTIRKELARGTFLPLPFATNPYRWMKADIVADFNRRAALTADEMQQRAKRHTKKPRTRSRKRR